MSRSFDIVMPREKVVGELLIRSLLFRDGMSATSRMVISATLDSRTVQMIEPKDSSVRLGADVTRISGTIASSFDDSVELAQSATIKVANKLSPCNSTVEIGSRVDGFNYLFSETFNGKVGIAATVQQTQADASLGSASFPVVIQESPVETSKTGRLSVSAPVNLFLGLTKLIKKSNISADCLTEIGASLSGVGRLELIGGNSAIGFGVFLSGIHVGKSLGRFNNGMIYGSSANVTHVVKYESVDAPVPISATVHESLVVPITTEPISLTIATDSLDIIPSRYRLFSDMDSDELMEYDLMSLSDVDMIEIT